MAKILVVDDDFTTQLILEEALQSEGYQVRVAQNGKDAWQIVQQWHPDSIVCDWMMPQMDGLSFCKLIKADPDLTTTFFILLTAREQVSDRVQGLDGGADDFLSKPIEIEELLARVRSGLRLQSLTRQLSQANLRLNQAFSELQQTQAKLVQSEKMFSLSKMVEGIAHEINNPITFIYSNLQYLEDYHRDLFELLSLYQQEVTNPSSFLEEKLATVELDFLVSDLPKLLMSMKTGAERIRQIILSVRNFSRLSEEGLKKVDIHEGLDNTLLILQSRLSTANYRFIRVVKEYGDLPLIECYPKEMNQVFWQIITNAIDALEEKQKAIEANYFWCQGKVKSKSCCPSSEVSKEDVFDWIPTIKISTKLLDCERILIQIINNGLLLPVEIQDKIFEPFFTTKSIGKGKGLGLFISYQIVVEQHQGSLKTIATQEGGTEFQIELPVSLVANKNSFKFD
ncbi:MAG: response regulator [Oscillatoria sp. PMC 1051.18]|nr:response regulator [Oscillatoria sp. PMC 1050.18]MEC5031284.1 response regulator [Oscillatoria sp. PMC 1051.18]